MTLNKYINKKLTNISKILKFKIQISEILAQEIQISQNFKSIIYILLKKLIVDVKKINSQALNKLIG